MRDALNNGEEIFVDIKHCQEKANEIHKKAKDFLEDESHANIKCTFIGVFLNIRSAISTEQGS